jgi:Uma2 family endonuclease
MATTLISIAEYLASNYEPDREYIDGVLEERNLGEYDHGRLQLVLGSWFLRHEHEWNLRAVVEQRIQVCATRFRVADVAVLDRTQPVQQILRQPPLIAIEVLSPADTWRRMEERIADYLNFGIPDVWVLDPGSRRAWSITLEGRREFTAHLKVADSPVAIPLEELFRELD